MAPVFFLSNRREDARVGFTVRYEPSGTVTLVMVGIESPHTRTSIEFGGSEPRVR